jgi:hypothetical protein
LLPLLHCEIDGFTSALATAAVSASLSACTALRSAPIVAVLPPVAVVAVAAAVVAVVVVLILASSISLLRDVLNCKLL